MGRSSRAADLDQNKENLSNRAAHSKAGCLRKALRKVGKSMPLGAATWVKSQIYYLTVV